MGQVKAAQGHQARPRRASSFVRAEAGHTLSWAPGPRNTEDLLLALKAFKCGGIRAQVEGWTGQQEGNIRQAGGNPEQGPNQGSSREADCQLCPHGAE